MTVVVVSTRNDEKEALNNAKLSPINRELERILHEQHMHKPRTTANRQLFST